ncbi:MAG: mandelate racemase [Chloroflexi bacterium]|nr:mandelate racemase [Chloroflexota bacterium]
MKVKDVTVDVLRRTVPSGTMSADRAGGFGGEIEAGLLRVVTDEGVEGNAFVGSFLRSGQEPLRAIIEVVKPEIIGHPIEDREWLWSRLDSLSFRRRLPAPAWAGVDIALWDIMGKVTGKPIYHLLGAQRHKVLAYASSPYYPRAELYVEEALAFKAKGFKAYKIHPGGAPVPRVKEITRRVREAVGDEMPLMVDASCMYTYREALEIGQAIQDLAYYWFEDPVRYMDLDAVAELSSRLHIPIAVSDYHEFGMYEALLYIERKAGRIIRTDAPREGITGQKKLASLCEAMGLNCEIHHGGNSLNNVANLHVILSTRSCDFYEWLLPSEAHQFGLVQDVTVDKEGYVHGPTAPGLGFELDTEALRRITVSTMR